MKIEITQEEASIVVGSLLIFGRMEVDKESQNKLIELADKITSDRIKDLKEQLR